MSLGFLELPLWGCIVLAFVPPIVIAFIGSRLSRKVDRADDNLMTTLARLSGAALVFVSAFLVGSLWTQTTAFLEGWRVEYRAAKELQRDAQVRDDAGAQRIQAAVETYLLTVRDTEVEQVTDWANLWQGSDQAAAALRDIAVTTRAASNGLSASESAQLQAGVDQLAAARDQRFERGVQSGTPLIILSVILLLAWSASLCLSMYPSGSRGWVKRFQTFMVVVIVGLVQLPVYYLIGSGPVREFVAQLLAT